MLKNSKNTCVTVRVRNVGFKEGSINKTGKPVIPLCLDDIYQQLAEKEKID